jgi:PadR family transcriptional regulator, regulatory protein PadR
MGKSDIKNIEISQLEQELLSVLLNNDKLYGLQIINAINEVREKKGNRKGGIGFGSAYPTLHKLQKKKFIAYQWGDETEDETGGARRKYYTITKEGQQALEQIWSYYENLEQWTRPEKHDLITI